MEKNNQQEFHRDRAAFWRDKYFAHKNAGRPGRAARAKIMYNLHMKLLTEIVIAEIDVKPWKIINVVTK